MLHHSHHKDTMMMYESSEFNLNRAVENIKLAQQVHKRELDKKDEIILALNKKLESMHLESREFTEYRRLHDKENRELLSEIQFLKHELSIERTEKERFMEDAECLRQDLSAKDDELLHLKMEKDKANHIIRNLLKKPPQIRLQPQPRST